MASTLTFIFISLLIATTFTRLWLGSRQIAHVQANRAQVPAAFSQNISLEAHQKAADYSSAKTKLALVEVVVKALLLAALTLGGGLQWIDDTWRNVITNHEIIRGAVVICSALFIGGLIDLPFEYYKTFTVDEKFGFNKMTKAMFFSDLFKHGLVGLALGLPILFAALWLMQGAGTYWWFYLWVVWEWNVIRQSGR